jgi:tRNA threonylcarbamoyladenosine modification (KEOPS) complex Cgi121 subunit
MHIRRQIKEPMLLIGISPGENRRTRLPIGSAEGSKFDQEAISEIEVAITSHRIARYRK